MKATTVAINIWGGPSSEQPFYKSCSGTLTLPAFLSLNDIGGIGEEGRDKPSVCNQ